jgi:hypothetical protein
VEKDTLEKSLKRNSEHEVSKNNNELNAYESTIESLEFELKMKR